MTSLSHPALREADVIARVRSRHHHHADPLIHTGDRSRASRPRRIAHLAVGALSWLVFVHLGLWLLVDDAPPDWWFVVAAVLALTLAFTLLTLAWVWWNDRSDPCAPS